MNTSDLPSATPTAIVPIIQEAIETNLPWAIAGAAGVGKTQVIRQIVESIDEQFQTDQYFQLPTYPDADRCILMDIMSPQYDEYTIRGTQMFQNKGDELITASASPSWLVQYNEIRSAYPNALVVVFIDEIGVMSSPAQASILQLINEKSVDQHRMDRPELVTFLAAYNRREDGASFFNLSQPLAGRFGGHTVMVPSVSAFLEWGHMTGKIAPEVDLFLSRHPESLVSYEEHGLQANAISPRGWEYVSRLLNNRRYKTDSAYVDLPSMQIQLQSRMPASILSQFLVDAALSKDMPRWQDVFMHPETAVVPENMVVQAMCLRGFGSQLHTQDDTDSFIVYSGRCRPEALASALKTLEAIAKKRPVPGLISLLTIVGGAENEMIGSGSKAAASVHQAAERASSGAEGRVRARKARDARYAADDAEDAKDETLNSAVQLPTKATSTKRTTATEIDFSTLM